MLIPSLLRALLEEKSVTISGFGTFYVKKVPAQIRDEIVYPPQNIIEFEYLKDAESFDFVSNLSRWEQIRIDEAQTEISEWINLLEKGLEHNKTIFYEDFGTFSKESSGKIAFQSIINSQLNIENEGFDPVIILSLSNQEKHQNISEPIQDKRVILTQKRKKRDWFWFAFTIIIATSTLSVLFLKDTLYHYYQTIFIENKIDTVKINIETNDTANVFNNLKEENNEITPTDENKQNINTDDFTSIENENKDNHKIVLSENKEIYIPYLKENYYVIAGSFTKEADALRHIKEKKLDKYHAKLVIQSQNPRIRVCIGVFDNEKDATDFAAQIEKNYWVLK